jgi:prepilin-type N-terminal cleavage/methylation domain-containing protein
MRDSTLKRQQGFTLIELAVASIIVGILLIVIVPHVYDSQNAGRAAQLERIASATVSNWATLSSAAGLPTSVANNVIAATPSATGVAEVLYVGSSKVASAYQATYDASGIKPLNQLVDNPSGSVFRAAGTIEVFITLSGGGPFVMTVQMQNVPLQVTRALIQRVRPDFPVTADATTYGNLGPWSYNCASTRVCTVTYSKGV